MEVDWIILLIVLVCAIVLIISLIIKNKRDKDEVIRFYNSDTDIEEEESQKGKKWEGHFCFPLELTAIKRQNKKQTNQEVSLFFCCFQ